MSTSRARAKLGSWSLAFTVAASSWCCGGDEGERTREAAGGSTAESGTSGDEAGAPQGSGASAGSSDVGPMLAEVCEKTCLEQVELGCAFPECDRLCQAIADPVE